MKNIPNLFCLLCVFSCFMFFWLMEYHVTSYDRKPLICQLVPSNYITICAIVQISTNSQFDWLIRGPSKAVLDLAKAYWTTSSVTIRSQHVLTNLRKVWNWVLFKKDHQLQFHENLPRSHRGFPTTEICEILVVRLFCLILTKAGFEWYLISFKN